MRRAEPVRRGIMEQRRPRDEPRPVEHETLLQASASRTIAANAAAPVAGRRQRLRELRPGVPSSAADWRLTTP